ncbi:MAG: DUF4418 family protein [Lachnospiraceae bacterium]|nr:DUF4418 family protein [Lachnospiraceae bacterium]
MKQKTKVWMGMTLLLSIVLLVGLGTFLKACGPKEDGGFMMCHYAEHALSLLAAVLAACHLLGLVLPRQWQVQNGLALASAIVCIAGILLPQNIIPLCMMNTMRCHSVMRPGASVLFGIILILDMVQCILTVNGMKKHAEKTR